MVLGATGEVGVWMGRSCLASGLASCLLFIPPTPSDSSRLGGVQGLGILGAQDWPLPPGALQCGQRAVGVWGGPPAWPWGSGKAPRKGFSERR